MTTPALDDPQAIRAAGRDLLSLALLDARNHVLQTLAGFDAPGVPAAQRQLAWATALHSAQWQQRWLLGAGQDGDAAADGTLNAAPDDAVRDDVAVAARVMLAQTLEASLDRLHDSADDPAALQPWHLALQLEDRLAEQLAVRLQRGAPPARAQRPPLWLPAQRWRLGAGHGSHPGVPFTAWGQEDVAVPEFEIDAQPVNWQQYAEFAADGGYDRPELWGSAGWAWLQDQRDTDTDTRRAPRHVAQLLGGVLVQRGLGAGAGAGLQRAPAGQAALHVTRFEAQAWCCWAGRRLPTEAEWELAAATASSRGFVWGDVWEWVLGSARPWPGAGSAPPGCADLPPPAGSQGVLRGASFATRRRWHHPQSRRYAAPGHDDVFCGFRSCAV